MNEDEIRAVIGPWSKYRGRICKKALDEAEKQARDAALQYHAIIDQAKEEGQKQKQKSLPARKKS